MRTWPGNVSYSDKPISSLLKKARKIGGSYQAEGTILAEFLADDGSKRYVFRFDNPAGLLHIFNDKQIELL